MATRGGDKFINAVRDVVKKAQNANVVRVGFLENSSPYPDGTSVAMVAAINEYGAPSRGQPPRPFFRSMVASKSPKWGKQLAAAMKQTDYDAQASLQIMGQVIKDQLVESINDFESPALASSTVKKKGFSKPLIDTAHMRNAADYEVK